MLCKLNETNVSSDALIYPAVKSHEESTAVAHRNKVIDKKNLALFLKTSYRTVFRSAQICIEYILMASSRTTQKKRVGNSFTPRSSNTTPPVRFATCSSVLHRRISMNANSPETGQFSSGR